MRSDPDSRSQSRSGRCSRPAALSRVRRIDHPRACAELITDAMSSGEASAAERSSHIVGFPWRPGWAILAP